MSRLWTHAACAPGSALAEVLPVLYVRRLGGAIFIVIGIAMFCEWLYARRTSRAAAKQPRR